MRPSYRSAYSNFVIQMFYDDLANILKDGGRAQLENMAPALEQLGLGIENQASELHKKSWTF